MRKNGFMIYELLISFTLAFAILLIIFNTTLSLNQKLSSLYVKNKVSTQQIIFNKKIGEDFKAYYVKQIEKVTSCTGNEYCYIITYSPKDGSDDISKKLNFSTSSEDQYIEYGTESDLERINLDDNAEIEIPEKIFETIEISNSDPYSGVLKLNIPIKHFDEDKNYGIELYYLYKDTPSIIEP